jgi:glyoxylase-like metal-dependent hydrolase (beta-lactamase superfamily II)
MKWGRFEVRSLLFGTFRLDGGAMFGSVPKNLWNKKLAADSENCIPLATRCLLISDGKRQVLVDAGNGEKWSDKNREIFAIKNTPLSQLPDLSQLTDIICTHLHFDHVGGLTEWVPGSVNQSQLRWPNARYHLQRSNLENAKNPTLKERASYLRENWEPLLDADLNLVSGSTEILADLWVHQIDGHTVGQQWIEIKNGARSIAFPTDLIPTSHHLPLPFHMGYDACATTVLKEKTHLLETALKNDWIIAFEHDPAVAAATIKLDERGHYAAKEDLTADILR